MIHQTAIVHPKAQIDTSVEIGAYAIIDEGVTLGRGCVVAPYVHLTGIVIAGENNHFHTGCVIGDNPQDLKYKGEPTRVIIGNNNVFREHVTIHRSNKPSEDTVIGSNNFLMAHSHVGHNAVIGNNVIVANGALIAGHVVVSDRAFISGNCLIHQFVRVGELALMQGGSAISKDLPPFTIARGDNGICGLNIVGLRRAGYTSEQRLELKKLYHFLFRSNLPLRDAVEKARAEFQSEAAKKMLDFIATTRRGVCTDKGALENGEEGE
ncbi:MAG: acyl-ACP--UDP-N-acetylglucosamine O-acyltransferase [Verrucomicrobiia bacterium]|jgi:UDP-N-acetylglucosamine acyltransferase